MHDNQQTDFGTTSYGSSSDYGIVSATSEWQRTATNANEGSYTQICFQTLDNLTSTTFNPTQWAIVDKSVLIASYTTTTVYWQPFTIVAGENNASTSTSSDTFQIYYKSDVDWAGNQIDPVLSWRTPGVQDSYLYAESNTVNHNWVAATDSNVADYGIGVFVR